MSLTRDSDTFVSVEDQRRELIWQADQLQERASRLRTQAKLIEKSPLERSRGIVSELGQVVYRLEREVAEDTWKLRDLDEEELAHWAFILNGQVARILNAVEDLAS